MNLNQLRPKTPRTYAKRVGRGGKRGTTSGKGTKGQTSRAGAGVKPGFRGGDNRLWQLFPKQRGATHKSGGAGNNRLHRKHRYNQFRADRVAGVNLESLNQFADGTEINREALIGKGLVLSATKEIKILGNGTLKKKLSFKGFKFSVSAQEKIAKAGGTII